MDLNNLIGKQFKYISKYDGKLCDFIGTVSRITTINNCKFGGHMLEIHIISDSNQSYLLNEIIFLN